MDCFWKSYPTPSRNKFSIFSSEELCKQGPPRQSRPEINAPIAGPAHSNARQDCLPSRQETSGTTAAPGLSCRPAGTWQRPACLPVVKRLGYGPGEVSFHLKNTSMFSAFENLGAQAQPRRSRRSISLSRDPRVAMACQISSLICRCRLCAFRLSISFQTSFRSSAISTI